MIDQNDLDELIKELDIEQIRREVFTLYDIKYGLDTQLALRKMQVLECQHIDFQNYLECLDEAHDRFLSFIFQGRVFNKMQQNPLHSLDLNHGVPQEFNIILNDLLDDNAELGAEDYAMQQMQL